MIRQFPFVQLKFSAAAKCDLPVCDICEFVKASCHTNQAVTMTKRITHYGSLKMEIFILVPQFMLIILNQDWWGVPLTHIVVSQQTYFCQ